MKCSRCELDFSGLPLELGFSARSRETARTVHCPACGQDIPLAVAQFGVFLRESERGTTYATWDVPGATGSAVRTRRLSVRFEPLERVLPASVCFPFVLLARSATGVSVPALPVRPEFFDVLDLDAARARTATGAPLGALQGRMVRYELPLRGLDQPAVVDIPVHGEVLEAVNLRVWPPPIDGWSRYLFGASAASEAGANRLARGDLALRARGTARVDWTSASSQNGGASLTGAYCEGTPEWLCLESREARAGGVFAVPGPRRLAATNSLQLGLDFGTSNTCLAYVDPATDRVEPIPALEDAAWNAYIVFAGAEFSQRRGHDFWPSGQGVGPRKDLFPSELVLPGTRESFAQLAKSARNWIAGVDFGLPTPYVSFAAGYDEAAQIVNEFKWAGTFVTRHPGVQPREVQAAYLEAVLAQCLVRYALRTNGMPTSVTVKYSFPLAFDDLDKNTLDGAVADACQRLGYTGRAWNPLPGLDEAAAAAVASGRAPGTALCAYVDMGGGTTDIALVWHSLDREGRETSEHLALTSVRFAGSTLFSAWAGDPRRPETAAVPPKVAGQLPKRLREATDPQAVFNDPEVFLAAFRKVVATRASTAFEHVLEYVARLVAGNLIDGRILDRDRRLPPTVPVELYFFGNGWQLLRAGGHTAVEQHLTSRIKARICKLLEDEPAAREHRDAAGRCPRDVELSVHFKQAVNDVPHAKAAVAYGLLKAEGGGGDRRTLSQRAIIGWPIEVGGQLVPWYLPYDRGLGYQLFEDRAAEARRAGRGAAPPPPVATEAPGGKVRFQRAGQTREGTLLGRDANGAARVEVVLRSPRSEEVALNALRLLDAPPADDLIETDWDPIVDGDWDPIVDGEGAIAEGSLVEFERNAVLLRGVVRTLRGEFASVEVRSAVVSVPAANILRDGVAGVAERTARQEHWNRDLPPALVNDVVLTIRESAVPEMDRAYKTPFALDPKHADGTSLPSTGGAVRRECRRVQNGWFGPGVYEALLTEVSAKLLYKVS